MYQLKYPWVSEDYKVELYKQFFNIAPSIVYENKELYDYYFGDKTKYSHCISMGDQIYCHIKPRAINLKPLSETICHGYFNNCYGKSSKLHRHICQAFNNKHGFNIAWDVNNYNPHYD